jgi:hypothetical protein
MDVATKNKKRRSMICSTVLVLPPDDLDIYPMDEQCGTVAPIACWFLQPESILPVFLNRLSVSVYAYQSNTEGINDDSTY